MAKKTDLRKLGIDTGCFVFWKFSLLNIVPQNPIKSYKS